MPRQRVHDPDRGQAESSGASRVSLGPARLWSRDDVGPRFPARRPDRRCLGGGATYVQQLCPGSPLSLVGFSLGASMVLKLLGRDEALPSNIDSAIAVAPPLDLQACSRNLNVRLESHLRSQLRADTTTGMSTDRRRQVPDLRGHAWPRPPETLYEFDQLFTAPLGGFRDVEDYYRRCSSLPDLQRIRVADANSVRPGRPVGARRRISSQRRFHRRHASMRRRPAATWAFWPRRAPTRPMPTGTGWIGGSWTG